ncbi:HAD family hydrolase [Cupriavidus taiwanensis]|uniref:HAD family hydrolase n=1 Tax=Cupriavidus taiwanensis TaxID=164546 RepID=UPI000E1537FD|nr:HAD family hydrolase [Cupriavidus taiwanensis]SOY49467.1 HAD-superfamily hydrolase, subfamily IA, variant 1 [Cupriavidus taiwanensis]
MTVVVLDLDDTLYHEADYQASGIRSVCARVRDLYGVTVDEASVLCVAQAGDDALAAVCEMASLPVATKESLLWFYRLHAPSIELSAATKAALETLQARFTVAILTDGRSVSQRLKLKALGLHHLPVYISEEYNSVKPEPLRFERVMHDFPSQAYVYVGDNPRKDFIAPNGLNWRTIGLRSAGRNIHSQSEADLPPSALPNQWIATLQELPELLC